MPAKAKAKTQKITKTEGRGKAAAARRMRRMGSLVLTNRGETKAPRRQRLDPDLRARP
jgi:hypothetical protein